MKNIADIKPKKENWRELRCSNCRKLMCFEYVFAGRLQIKCDRCGELNTFFFKVPEKLLAKLIQEDYKLYPILKKEGGA